MNAAYLLAQLEHAQMIYDDRMRSWEQYHAAFEELERRGRVERPVVPKECRHNAHMYYLKAKDMQERTELIHYLSETANVGAVSIISRCFRSSGLKFGRWTARRLFDEESWAAAGRSLRLYSRAGDRVVTP